MWYFRMRIEEYGTGEDLKLLLIGDDGKKTKFVLKSTETWANRKGTQSLSRSNCSYWKCYSYVWVMYPSRSSVQTLQSQLTLEKMMETPKNFTFSKCEKSLERFNEFYCKEKPKLMIYLIHDNTKGYSGD